jgi:hypothetical protein
MASSNINYLVVLPPNTTSILIWGPSFIQTTAVRWKEKKWIEIYLSRRIGRTWHVPQIQLSRTYLKNSTLNPNRFYISTVSLTSCEASDKLLHLLVPQFLT